MQLRRFREHIQSLIGNEEPMRPFNCDGRPYDCKAFVVGINPASSIPFWKFWSDESGFDRTAWVECYRQHRFSKPLKSDRVRCQPISNTRQRIDWIVEAAAPVKILETNLYALPTKRAAELGNGDRDSEAFRFLIAEISPSLILLHEKEVHHQFRKLYGYAPTSGFQKASIRGRETIVAAVPHLSRASRARAIELGQGIRSSITGLLAGTDRF